MVVGVWSDRRSGNIGWARKWCGGVVVGACSGVVEVIKRSGECIVGEVE